MSAPSIPTLSTYSKQEVYVANALPTMSNTQNSNLPYSAVRQGGLNQVLQSSSNSTAYSIQARLQNIRSLGANESGTKSGASVYLSKPSTYAYPPAKTSYHSSYDLGRPHAGGAYGQLQPRQWNSNYSSTGSFPHPNSYLQQPQQKILTSASNYALTNPSSYSNTNSTAKSASLSVPGCGQGQTTTNNGATNSLTAQMLAQGRPLSLSGSQTQIQTQFTHVSVRYSADICSQTSSLSSKLLSREHYNDSSDCASGYSEATPISLLNRIHIGQPTPQFLPVSLAPSSQTTSLLELGISNDLLLAISKSTKDNWDISRQYSFEYLTHFIGDLCEKMGCEVLVVLTGMVYTKRLRDRFPDSGARSCAKRVFVMGLMIATKFHHDRPYNNKAWATMVKMSLPLLNRMEEQFVESLDFDLNVTVEDLLAAIMEIKTHMRPLIDLIEKVKQIEVDMKKKPLSGSCLISSTKLIDDIDSSSTCVPSSPPTVDCIPGVFPMVVNLKQLCAGDNVCISPRRVLANSIGETDTASNSICKVVC